MTAQIVKLAEIVDEAARHAKAIPQLTLELPKLTVEDGYEIQALSVARRIDRGERRVGIKMGLTSRAKMQQVGVDEVVWGRLTDAMMLEEGGSLSLKRYVHPRIEPEIAFLIGSKLEGHVSGLEAMAAVDGVAPAMEVIDSRYKDFKFALPDVVADNSSSSGLVVGSWRPPELDISNLGIVLGVNGRPVQVGSSAAILGNPVRSLVAAVKLASQAGESLEPGDIVLAGAATAAHPLSAGETISGEVQDLGRVTISVEG